LFQYSETNPFIAKGDLFCPSVKSFVTVPFHRGFVPTKEQFVQSVVDYVSVRGQAAAAFCVGRNSRAGRRPFRAIFSARARFVRERFRADYFACFIDLLAVHFDDLLVLAVGRLVFEGALSRSAAAYFEAFRSFVGGLGAPGDAHSREDRPPLDHPACDRLAFSF
jgi:hypothetical protein